MSNSALERCPRCGSPYMSAILPNESSETRYCYTCTTASAGTKQQIAAATSVDVNDFELQPLADAPSSGSTSRAQVPQVAPQRGGTRVVRSTTSMAKVRAQDPAAVASSSSARIRAVPPGSSPALGAVKLPATRIVSSVPPPTASGSHKAASASGSRNAATSSGSHRAVSASGTRRSASGVAAIPQMAPSASDFRPENSGGGFPVKLGVGLCACGLLAVILFYAFKGSNTSSPANTAVAVATLPSSTVPAVAKTPAVIVAPSKSPTPPVIAKQPDNVVSHPDFAPGVGQIGPKTAVLPAEIQKTDPKPATTDLTDIIGSKPRRSTKNGTIEEEEAPIAKTLKPKSTDDAPAVPEEPKPDPAPNAVAANPDDPDDALDKNGKPKKKVRSLLENLTGPDDKPVKPEVEKKEENPFAPKIVSVTATEPKVMPLELDRIAGNDKTLTQQVVVLFPDWRVRDAQFENSKIGIQHMGRDKVVSLTPVNDSLAAKLVATVEIPKSFALQRPTLLFEVSSLVATGKDWTLSVKAMGVDLLPKTKIKLAKDTPWQDMSIDLSPLADKHFDLQIEVSSSVKHPKGGATEIGFIRNVRIEWVGKKK